MELLATVGSIGLSILKAIHEFVTLAEPWGIALAVIALMFARKQLKTNGRVYEATLLAMVAESLQAARQTASDSAARKLFPLILSLKAGAERELDPQELQRGVGIYLQAALDLSRSKGTDLELLYDVAKKAITSLRLLRSSDSDLESAIDALQRELDTSGDGPPSSDRTSHIRIVEKAVQMGVELNGLSFRGSSLDGARLSRGSFVRANLWQASFIGSDLSNSDLRRANPQKTRFTGADLSGAELSECQFFDAVFFYADLTGAKLKGAYLTGAKLDDCNLSNTDLRETVGLTKEQLAKACGSNVKLPDEIPDTVLKPPPADWACKHQIIRNEFSKSKH